jgi:phenylacetate-coenzyme A ligase PaaK-like adenylate-forming protein
MGSNNPYLCSMSSRLSDIIFDVTSANFEQLALEVFRFQAEHNAVYKKYLDILRVKPSEVQSVNHIPYLPIAFFKSHNIYIGDSIPQAIFTSSGTTGAETSKHPVRSVSLYEQSFMAGFKQFYGNPTDYTILALLPSYLEREGSSLVYMVQQLIKESRNSQSGFFLNEHNKLVDIILEQELHRRPTILIGVTFALLELASSYKMSLSSTIIMETGGMKGRGKELTRSEMHLLLKDAFGVGHIHSEYGMTELLSQAYSKGDGLFETPPWMQVLVRDPYDPFTLLPKNSSGAINVIDLANLYSCSFIQTDDLGKLHANGTFEVLGRMDGSQVRGCNMLVL